MKTNCYQNYTKKSLKPRHGLEICIMYSPSLVTVFHYYQPLIFCFDNVLMSECFRCHNNWRFYDNLIQSIMSPHSISSVRLSDKEAQQSTLLLLNTHTCTTNNGDVTVVRAWSASTIRYRLSATAHLMSVSNVIPGHSTVLPIHDQSYCSPNTRLHNNCNFRNIKIYVNHPSSLWACHSWSRPEYPWTVYKLKRSPVEEAGSWTRGWRFLRVIMERSRNLRSFIQI